MTYLDDFYRNKNFEQVKKKCSKLKLKYIKIKLKM